MNENENTKPTLNDEAPDVLGEKQKAKAPDCQASLDMLSSAIKYLRECGVNIQIRQSEKHGAVITMAEIQALNDDWFMPLPNQPNNK